MNEAKYLELPAHVLLNKFAAGTPTPGGGSASALAGALGAALARMVAGLTVAKKGYEAVEEDAKRLLGEADSLKDRLANAVEEDAASYECVMAAMALPKITVEEKEARKQAMQEALKGATLAPIGVANACMEAANLALKMLTIGNENACTDAAVGVLLAAAGVEGALLNVSINLSSINDENWVQEQRAQADAVRAELKYLRATFNTQLRAHGLEVVG